MNEEELVGKTMPYGNDDQGAVIDEEEDNDTDLIHENEKKEYSQAFNDALKLVLKYEGGYVNHPNDPGGATNKGVIQKVYDAYRTDLGQETRSVKEITDEEVSEIYFRRYWLAGKCDKLQSRLAVVHFDSCVNAGTKQSAKFLQRAAGAVADGMIGPKTLQAVNDKPEQEMIDSYLQQRRDFYNNLAESKPKLQVFLKGWLNRVAHLDEFVNNGTAYA